MSKTERLKVVLGFEADTSRASSQINTLKRNLTSIANTKFKIDDTQAMRDSIKQASQAAAELNVHLKAATNQDTGRIDFSRFSSSLKKSNIDLIEYANTIRRVGDDGEKAFLQIANSIINAEVPLRRSNKILNNFWKELKRMAMWEISSKFLHGTATALNGALRYAQDLNQSLNDIRIVTGYNKEEMAAFAKEANKAAKALSTTTNEYTKASLIYFQQGLSKKEVKERTDVTIKMANVARESSEKVSEQLTAVWNNFYNGTKTLEYYADVMTALGADTASSVDEISLGLNKFASVAETVGLSYEYAASALATVTSTTRESADTVGTAFKTLFARIQDLELGKTLDDGTTIGEYAKALEAVGISVKDSNGGLKDMDALLSEMAEKWNTLSKDSQVALAQNVAGVRQYTHLVALLDNWDFFQSNLQTSLTSTGELDKQAKIYAESWEAARDRVEASLETIYEKLLDDDAFIKLLNTFSKIIDSVDYFIDRLGGLKGVMSSLGVVLTSVFSKQLSQSIRDTVYGFNMMFLGGDKKAMQDKIALMKQFRDSLGVSQTNDTNKVRDGESSTSNRRNTKVLYQEIYDNQLKAQTLMMQNAGKFSKEEEIRINQVLKKYSDFGNKVITISTKLDKLAEKRRDIEGVMKASLNQQGLTGEYASVQAEAQNYEKLLEKETILRTLDERIGDETDLNKIHKISEDVKQELSQTFDLKKVFGKNLEAYDAFAKKTTKGDREAELGKLLENRTKAQVALVGVDGDNKHVKKSREELSKTIEQSVEDRKKEAIAIQQTRETAEESQKALEIEKNKRIEWSEAIVKGANAVLSLTSAINILSSLDDTWQNPNLTFWEKLVTTFTSVAMAIPLISSGMKSLKAIVNTETLAKITNIFVTKEQIKTETQLANVKQRSARATDKNTEEINQETVAKTANATVDKIKVGKGQAQEISVKKGKYHKIGRVNGTGGFKYYGIDKAGKQQELKIEEAAKLASTDKKGLQNALNQQKPLTEPSIGIKPTTATNKLKTGASNLGAKTKTFVGAHSAAIGAIATAAVIIASAVIAFKALDKAWNKDAIAAENAAKAAEQAAENYNSAKTEYENLQKTIEAYSSAKNNLDGLVEGTLEFKEALIAANDEAHKLIEQYDNLQYIIDSNGLINIDADSFQDAKEKEFEQMNQARTASLIANQNAKNKQLEADITEFNRNTAKDWDGGSGDSWNSTGKGAAIGAGIGAALGATLAIALAPFTGGLSLAAGLGIGALVAGGGALAGAQTGAGIGNVLSLGKGQTEDEKNLIKKMGELYKDQGSAVFNKEHLLKELQDLEGKEEGFDEGWVASNKKLIDSLFAEENIEATKKLTKEIAANTAANEAQNKLLTQQDLTNNKAVQNSQYSDQITTIVNSQRDAEIQKMITGEGKLAGWGKNNISQISTEKDKDAQKVWKEYLESMGIDSKEMENYKLEGVIGNDKNRAFTYRKKKEDGTWDEELITVDLDDMVEQRAQFLVKDKLNAIGSDYAKKFKGQNETTVGLAQAIIANDYSKMTLGSLDGEADKANKALLKDQLGLSDEEINNTLQKAKEAWEIALSNFTFKGKEAVKDLSANYSNLSKESAEAYGKMIDTVFKRGGSTAVDGMKDITSKLLEATSGNLEKQQALLMRMANINWEDGASGLNDLELILQDLNIEIPEGIESLKGFKEVLESIDFASVTFDLNALRKELTALNELLPKVKIGEIITDEQYKTLLKYNAGLKDFFVMTASGYSYIGGAGDIEQDIKGAEVSKIKKSYDANRAAYNDIKNRATTEGAVDYSTLTENASADELINFASYITDLDTEGDTAILKAIGVDRTWLQNQIDKLESDSNDETARAELEKFFSDVATIQSQGNLGTYDNALGGEEMAVFETVETVEELIDLLSKGEISYATYEKTLSFIQERSEKLTDTWEENLRKIKESVSATHDLDKAIELIDIRLKKLNTDTEDLLGEDFAENYLQGLELAFQKTAKLVDKRSELNEKAQKAWKDLEYEANLKDYGLNFDDEGNLLNGGEILRQAQEKLLTAQNDAGANASEDEARKIAAAQRDFDTIKRLIEGYDQSREDILNNEQSILDAWVSVKESLYNAYAEAIDKQGEAIEQYTDRIDASISTLDSFKSILELTGKSSSKEMRLILESTANTSKALMDIGKAEYEQYSSLANSAKEEFDKYVAENGANEADVQYQTLKRKWLKAQEDVENSQQEILEKTKAWGEAMKAQIEYDMSEASKALEKAFTGGKTFDELTTSMERSSLLQEEYLTSTNKVYEISKLTRNVQANIDKTTNSVAKRKLKAFMDETKQLQDQEKLSKFELDLQQKKYDLLVAEIALQEAQEAKSTVRLTRTADGGFGYVYTADENKVAEAQQKYEDAENALYNTRLEGANNYAEKSIQAQQEFLQALQELNTQYLNGEITSEEEYQRKREELVNYFNEQLATYNSSYNLAISEDAAIARDAWSTEFANMVIDAESWQQQVVGHIDIIDEKFEEWKDVIDEVETAVGSDLESLSTKTGAIATSTNEAITALIGEGGLVGALTDTAKKISNYITTTLQPWLAELEKIKKAQGEINNGLPTGQGATGELNPWQKISAAFQKGDMASATAVINDMTDISDEHKQNLISGLSWGKTGSGHSNQNDIASAFSSGEEITEETAAEWAKNASSNPKGKFSWDTWRNGSYKEAKQFLQDSGQYTEEEINKIMSGKGYYDSDNGYNNIKDYYNSLGQNGTFDNNKFEKAFKEDLLLRIIDALKEGRGIENILEDDEFGVLSSKETKALMALSFQAKLNKEKVSEIIENLKDGINGEQIKKSLDFEVLRNYISKQDGKLIPVLDNYWGKYETEDVINLNNLLDNGEVVAEGSDYFIMKSPGSGRGKFKVLKETLLRELTAFNTGGYTGSWGPEGKMAMLHQKEIVLNKTDTANFLESIKLLRSILSFIDLQATNAQFSSLSSNARFTPSTSEVLEQNVHIDAHFDNVTDRNEIVEAFNTLVNRASQYANRKK